MVFTLLTITITPSQTTMLWHSNEVSIHHKPHFYKGWMLDRSLAVQSKSHVCITLEIVVCNPTRLHRHSSLLVVGVPGCVSVCKEHQEEHVQHHENGKHEELGGLVESLRRGNDDDNDVAKGDSKQPGGLHH